jgi:integrase
MGARWDEIDLAEAVWTIPAERMKDGKQHRVPLSPRAVELLRELPRESAWVFVGPRKGAGLGKMAMWDVLQRMGRGDITVHGFRSTFRDWAAERTAYPNHVVEQALAHHIGNAVEAAYRRGDLFAKRVRLMADWASYCAQPQRRDPTVTPLRAVGV